MVRRFAVALSMLAAAVGLAVPAAGAEPADCASQTRDLSRTLLVLESELAEADPNPTVVTVVVDRGRRIAKAMEEQGCLPPAPATLGESLEACEHGAFLLQQHIDRLGALNDADTVDYPALAVEATAAREAVDALVASECLSTASGPVHTPVRPLPVDGAVPLPVDEAVPLPADETAQAPVDEAVQVPTPIFT